MLPGPTFSLTMQTSLAAVGVPALALPDSSKGSPFLNDFTVTTVVLASGLNAVFKASSHARGALAGELLPPPQAVKPPATATHVATLTHFRVILDL